MYRKELLIARMGAILYCIWGVFHMKVARDVYILGSAQEGIAQGRTYQLAAYLLTLSIFVVGVAVVLNWRNSARGFWLNLCIAGWADGIWMLVVVLPGYVGAARGLVPPAIFASGAMFTWLAQRRRKAGTAATLDDTRSRKTAE